MSDIKKRVYLVSSGDLRLAANQNCWEAQYNMEKLLTSAIETEGWKVERAHFFDKNKKHGFIDSQRMGIDIFKNIEKDVPLIVAESVWQYSHHVLAGLTTHTGPILTIANWSGQWPGLVGMLNLNGSLTKAEVKYSTLWSEDFKDDFFINKLKEWLDHGKVIHDESHVKSLNEVEIPQFEWNKGKTFGDNFVNNKAIMGVFDEGCMGMFNAIVPDKLLHKTGIFKERLSQSSLYAKMLQVKDDEAGQVLAWLLERGMTFNWGNNDETDLTKKQTLEQCKMYIAAVRIADEFGCDSIGIQYQQGLKDLTVASDLAEGLLNNRDRPPVYSADGRELFSGEALPHFNEVDECAGIDALVTYRLWKELGMKGETTLHDIRWGKKYQLEGIETFIWVFLISGAAPPEHFIGGYKGAVSDRQPSMYFRLGGGSLKGISKPGNIVWSRIYIENDALQCDIGTGKVVALPEEETFARWQQTTPEWPIMHATINGVNRDQMMAKHKANHIQVVYAGDEKSANSACLIKAAALAAMGVNVHFCGDVKFQ